MFAKIAKNSQEIYTGLANQNAKAAGAKAMHF
jgi:hypothetical protein